MPRRLAHLTGAITFLPILLVCIFWLRSHFIADRFNTPRTDCAVARGEIMIAWFAAAITAEPPLFHHTYTPESGHFNWHEDTRATRYLNLAGFALATFPSYTPPSSTTTLIIFPIWSFALIASVPPLLYLRRLHRAYQRRAAHRCTRCGYDLRATPDRCPECGEIPIAASSVSSGTP